MSQTALPPGPRLPPVVQAVLWTHFYERFTRVAHRRYGPTFSVRIGGSPPAVVTVDRDAIRRLYSGDPLVRRHGNEVLRPYFERSLLVLEPAPHLARRKLLLPAFHGERVRGWARLIERLVEAELGRWRAGEVVRVQPLAQALTLEVILQAVLGISDRELRGRLAGIFDRLLRLPGSALGFYFPKYGDRTRANFVTRPVWRLKDQLDAMIAAHIAATRADPGLEARDDVLAVLVCARDESGAGLGDAVLLDEVNALILAGHETTTSAIAWGAELLVQHPRVLARARSAADDGDDEYLDALVKEVLRMRSPVTPASARHVLEPFPIGPYTIGPQHQVVVNAHGLHSDPTLYPEPHAFRPERFLDGQSDGYSFVPFGGGAHRCIGAALAQLEIKVVLRAILRRFELAPAARRISRPKRRAITLAPRGGGRVRVVAQRGA